MTTRQEALDGVNRLFDRIEADGRHAVGFAAVVPHMGAREGVDHTTIESEVHSLTHEKMGTALLGGVGVLQRHVAGLMEYTEFEVTK